MTTAEATIASGQVLGAIRISLRDENALEWFFGPGEAVFHRSTFGGMIERLDLDSHLTRRCDRCKGVGLTDEDVAASTATIKAGAHKRPQFDKPVRERIKIAEFKESGDHLEREVERWRQFVKDSQPKCKDCGGRGHIPLRAKVHVENRYGRAGCRTCQGRMGGVQFGEKRTFVGAPATGRTDCEECHGDGYVEFNVAFDTSTMTEASGYIPNEQALDQYAIVSRRLGEMGNPHLVEVLHEYYGDTGARWGRTRHGRIFALYMHTPAAKTLLRQTKSEGDTRANMTPLERIGVQAELDRTQRKQSRYTLLCAAETQARALYERAADAWNHTERRRRAA